MMTFKLLYAYFPASQFHMSEMMSFLFILYDWDIVKDGVTSPVSADSTLREVQKFISLTDLKATNTFRNFQ